MITLIVLSIALNVAGYSSEVVKAFSTDTRAIIVAIAVASDINIILHSWK